MVWAWDLWSYQLFFIIQSLVASTGAKTGYRLVELHFSSRREFMEDILYLLMLARVIVQFTQKT